MTNCSLPDAIAIFSKDLKNGTVISSIGDKAAMNCLKKIKKVKYLDISKLGDTSVDIINNTINNNCKTGCVKLIISLYSEITGVYCDITNIFSYIKNKKNVECLLIVNSSIRDIVGGGMIKKINKLCADTSSYAYFKCINMLSENGNLRNVIGRLSSITNNNTFVEKIIKQYEASRKIKSVLIERLSAIMPVIPLNTFYNTYEESHVFTTAVIFDNKGNNDIISMSIVSSRATINSNRLFAAMKEYILADSKTINSFAEHFQKDIKRGFVSFDISGITTIAKLSAFYREIVSCLSKISTFTEEVKYTTDSKKLSNTSHNKKVRFSTKLYEDSGPKSCYAKKYKNGKPVSILKKKSMI